MGKLELLKAFEAQEINDESLKNVNVHDPVEWCEISVFIPLGGNRITFRKKVVDYQKKCKADQKPADEVASANEVAPVKTPTDESNEEAMPDAYKPFNPKMGSSFKTKKNASHKFV